MQHPTQRKIRLCDDQGLGKIEVDLEAFFDLSFWMAEELLDLTGRWSRTANNKGRSERREPRKLVSD